MDKKEIIKIFKEIEDKVENGQVCIQHKSTHVFMPFTTITNFMELTEKSELEFAYKSHLMAEMTPAVMIHSVDIENISLAKAENGDLFGEYKIKFIGTSDISIIATVNLKENEQFEILKL